MKDKLKELGYSESQIEKIITGSKLYFQEDVDNIVDKSKMNLTKKFEKDYVSKSELESLEVKYNQAMLDLNSNNVRKVFDKLGGKQNKEFDAFLSLNKDLLENDKQSNLEQLIQERSTNFDWAFESSKPNVNDKQIVSELLGDDKQDEFFPNTLIKYGDF